MTPAEIAERINDVRAEQGLAPIFAKVGVGGEIVSVAKGRPVERATPTKEELRRPGCKAQNGTGKLGLGGNRNIRFLVLDYLKEHAAPKTARQVAEATEADVTYVRAHLKALVKEGLLRLSEKRKPVTQRGRAAQTYEFVRRA